MSWNVPPCAEWSTVAAACRCFVHFVVVETTSSKLVVAVLVETPDAMLSQSNYIFEII